MLDLCRPVKATVFSHETMRRRMLVFDWALILGVSEVIDRRVSLGLDQEHVLNHGGLIVLRVGLRCVDFPFLRVHLVSSALLHLVVDLDFELLGLFQIWNLEVLDLVLRVVSVFLQRERFGHDDLLVMRFVLGNRLRDVVRFKFQGALPDGLPDLDLLALEVAGLVGRNLRLEHLVVVLLQVLANNHVVLYVVVFLGQDCLVDCVIAGDAGTIKRALGVL